MEILTKISDETERFHALARVRLVFSHRESPRRAAVPILCVSPSMIYSDIFTIRYSILIRYKIF